MSNNHKTHKNGYTRITATVWGSGLTDNQLKWYIHLPDQSNCSNKELRMFAYGLLVNRKLGRF